MDVDPFVIDITDYVVVGDENVIDYDACRVSGNNCVTPPTCQGDGYCPEIAMSSYIIISYYYMTSYGIFLIYDFLLFKRKFNLNSK